MLVIVALARTPATQTLPAVQQTYSLSVLLSYMGIDWPAGLPDIVISEFSCTDEDGRIKLGGKLNVKDITFDHGVAEHVLAILPDETLCFTVVIDIEPGLAIGTVQLQGVFDSLTIPVGNEKIILNKPTVLFTLTPLFKFVVFELKAVLPFSLFNSPGFEAQVAMTIDNVEAEIGVELDDGQHTLLTPPGIKGLHFDRFGVGMGLFFEPPGFALGIQGNFHIGDGEQVIELDDDQFVLVCKLEEGEPNPLFLSFNVPKMSIGEVMTLFTNKPADIDFPIVFSNLSFRWAENPMEPVTLPDGSLAPMGYGFSAAMDLFGLGFYADLSIDMNNGLLGKAELPPFSLGPVLSLTGNGAGVTFKVDSDGNPIPNNTLPQNAAEKKAIDDAPVKQFVAPGGPQLQISTAGSPYFTLNSRLAFLEFHDDIDATIDKSGIQFALDFNGIISSKMNCVLQDYHNFSGQFSWGPDLTVPLPVIAGMSLGQVHLTTQIDVTLGLTTSTSDVVFSAGGGFDFIGIRRQIGPFNLDIHIAALSDVLSAIEQWILNNAAQLFTELTTDASKWSQLVYSGVILPAAHDAGYALSIFKNGFGKAVSETGDLLKGSAYAANDVAAALKNIYGASASDVASTLSAAYQTSANDAARALNSAGYAADQIATSLRSVFSLDDVATAAMLKGLGYGASQIASALSSAYGAATQAVASALRSIGFNADDTALALQAAFNLSPDAMNKVLQGAGYAEKEVETAFKSMGGAFADLAESIFKKFNPLNW